MAALVATPERAHRTIIGRLEPKEARDEVVLHIPGS